MDDPVTFEHNNVTLIYSKIANHFNHTRYHTWPKIQEFVYMLPTNSTIYDIGCGNGRNMNIRDDCKFIGCDNNIDLLQIAKNKSLQCEYGDNLSLPYQDNQADAILSIAVIHHFSTYTRRLQALSELFRILKPTGKGLIYVWCFEQKKFNGYSKDAMVPWHNQSDNEIVKRYYYLFNQGELEKMINDHFKDIDILSSGTQFYNYFVIVEKNIV